MLKYSIKQRSCQNTFLKFIPISWDWTFHPPLKELEALNHVFLFLSVMGKEKTKHRFYWSWQITIPHSSAKKIMVTIYLGEGRVTIRQKINEMVTTDSPQLMMVRHDFSTLPCYEKI